MKHKQLIDQMTLQEKCSLLSGRDIWSTKPVERLGIPSIYLSDGPSGLRKQVGAGDHLGLNASLPATCWPTAATVANSWDPKLGERIGCLLGEEAAAQGVSVVLGPGLNVKRSPLCGRNFEYFSEDPYLAGKLAAGYIRGIQSKGVAACPKHFAANSQELCRMASDSVMDERTLREVYLTNFEIAVREGKPKSIMSAYNMVNGVYANENRHLLQEILVEEWGFEGAVVTDWGGSNDHVAGVAAGSHLEMPATAGDSDRQLERAVAEGQISEALVDQRVDELLELILDTAQKTPAAAFNEQQHHDLAQKAAEQTIVLLKNEGGTLPLAAGETVAVVGDFASLPRYQGAGSSVVNPTQLQSALEALPLFPVQSVGYAQGFLRDGTPSETLVTEAVELAGRAETVLLYLGLPEIEETEGLDRQKMQLPQNQVELLKALAKATPNLVVVLAAGSPVEMPWLEDCRALVHGYLGGQAGAAAMLRVLTGAVNPSGKLAESYPLRLTDLPNAAYYPARQRGAEYREGLYVGYRYYETAGVPVLFPFGFGLSYTSFAYSELKVSDSEVNFTLKNTGDMAGAEVAQLYVSCPDGAVFRPAKELKGFAKVWLEPGQAKRVSIALDDKAFRYFNVKTGRWEVESAVYELAIGASVADLRLRGRVKIEGTNAPCPYDPQTLPSYYSGQVQAVQTPEFAGLLGYTPASPVWNTAAPLGMNDAVCQMYYAKSGLARLVYKLLTHLKNKSVARGKPDLNLLFIYNLPFRGIAKMMNGAVTLEMAEALLVMVNGQFCKGFGRLVRGWRAAHKAQKSAKK